MPLALLDAGWRGDGRILMLEPRRLATRAAAARMSALIGENTRETVGFRTRLDSAMSDATRIEVVTEGLLVRRLQSDPGLAGVAAVILDEVHERSLESDLPLPTEFVAPRLTMKVPDTVGVPPMIPESVSI